MASPKQRFNAVKDLPKSPSPHILTLESIRTTTVKPTKLANLTSRPLDTPKTPTIHLAVAKHATHTPSSVRSIRQTATPPPEDTRKPFVKARVAHSPRNAPLIGAAKISPTSVKPEVPKQAQTPAAHNKVVRQPLTPPQTPPPDIINKKASCRPRVTRVGRDGGVHDRKTAAAKVLVRPVVVKTKDHRTEAEFAARASGGARRALPVPLEVNKTASKRLQIAVVKKDCDSTPDRTMPTERSEPPATAIICVKPRAIVEELATYIPTKTDPKTPAIDIPKFVTEHAQPVLDNIEISVATNIDTITPIQPPEPAEIKAHAFELTLPVLEDGELKIDTAKQDLIAQLKLGLESRNLKQRLNERVVSGHEGASIVKTSSHDAQDAVAANQENKLVQERDRATTPIKSIITAPQEPKHMQANETGRRVARPLI
ncbi:hypothetical protein PHLCEN_2v12683 [Hermanssonia centrifuga]|uniref:Uncharacterized protein n=1 Tax=Hermanssonia centrifuga TaxID=98765 RepID=A0A2R6NGD9_9APHY|nr:hypothetical protein PHLCEN_2v12683 [Hermanssonia centrifuga]